MGKGIYLKIVLAISIFSTIYFRIYSNLSNSKDFFWDSLVYYCGPLLFNETGNGYGSLINCSKDLVDFKFVYLPIYLRLLNFEGLSPANFEFLWISLMTISLLVTILIIRTIYNENSLTLTLLLSLFCFSGIPLYGYLSGNISNALYVFTALGIFQVSTNNPKKINIGLILITIPSLFKIHMIIYLLSAFIAIKRINPKLFSILITLPFCFLFLNSYLYPYEFSLLSSNISILPYIGDMGLGSIQVINFIKSSLIGYGTAFKSGKHEWLVSSNLINSKDFIIDYLIYLLLLILIIHRVYRVKLINLSKNINIDKKLKISIGLIATYLIIPRLKQYDMVLCSIPLLYIVNSSYFLKCINKLIFLKGSGWIILLFNIIILGFYNIKGDNYFIYPIILTIFLICTNCTNKKHVKDII